MPMSWDSYEEAFGETKQEHEGFFCECGEPVEQDGDRCESCAEADELEALS